MEVGGSPLGFYEFRGWAELGGKTVCQNWWEEGREWLTTEVKLSYKWEAVLN